MQTISTHTNIIKMIDSGEGEKIDLAGEDLRGIDLSGRTLRNIVFSNYHDGKITNLDNAHFRGCTFEDVKFSGAILSRTDFRNCKFNWCDFRYIRCSQSTFQDSHFNGCDFYRANFEDYSLFEGAKFIGVSLFMANLQGAGLRRSNLGNKLLQEDKNLFEAFHYHFMNVSEESIKDFLARRNDEAMQIYRHLTGLWTSQGFFQDASWAYVKSKRNEKMTYSPKFAHLIYHSSKIDPSPTKSLSSNIRVTSKYIPKYVLYWIIDLICGFGESLGRLIASIIVLLLGCTFIYWSLGLLTAPDGTVYTQFVDNLIFSVGNLTTTDFGRFIPINKFTEVLISFQALLGISMVGLLGFILGNKIRNS